MSVISVIVIAVLSALAGVVVTVWGYAGDTEAAWEDGWSAGYQAVLRTSEHFSQVPPDPLHRQKRTEQGLEHANNPIPLCTPKTPANGPQNSAHERNQK